MFGDLFNTMRTFWRQNVKCRHEYRVRVRSSATQTFEIKECRLCGRTKVKEI